MWQARPPCLFLMVWKARNGMTFKDDTLFIQKFKISFVSRLWSETKMFIEDSL